MDYKKLSLEDLRQLLSNAQRCLNHKKKAWRKRAPILVEDVENELRLRESEAKITEITKKKNQRVS